jgi:hypothetical protein
MHEVLDGNRKLRFDGALLAYSTSYRPGSSRWVEFALFRTVGGAYVLSRVGKTTLYHTTECSVARRAGLPPTPSSAIPQGKVPCSICNPHIEGSEDVCVEISRNWAQTTTSASSIVDMLYQYDESGARYLTGVARRLLEEASDQDPGISDSYRVEIIY